MNSILTELSISRSKIRDSFINGRLDLFLKQIWLIKSLMS